MGLSILDMKFGVFQHSAAPKLSVVSEADVVPSAAAVGAVHCWVRGSNVPAAISQSPVGAGHPWHIPESQMPFSNEIIAEEHMQFRCPL